MFLRAIASRIITLVAVLCACFIALEALPGDACTTFLEQDAHDGELLQNCRANLGIDRPILTRFGDWASALLHGDLGTSLARDRPVLEIIAPRARNTFVLAGLSALIAVPAAIALGILTAMWRDSIFDVGASAVFLAAMTIPEFVIATILIFIFAITLQWLPAVTIVAANSPLLELIPNIVLPVIVLTIVMIAHTMRVVRTSMIDAMQSDFVQAGQLRGLSFQRIVIAHALPSALPPALNVVALSLASLLGGVVVVERVFNYPGLGTLTLQAIHDRDMPVVQATVVIFTATYIGLTLLADGIAALIDPRIRRGATQ